MELHKLGNVLTTIGGILSSIGTRLVVQHAEDLEKSVADTARTHYLMGRNDERRGAEFPPEFGFVDDEQAHQADELGADVDEHQADEHTAAAPVFEPDHSAERSESNTAPTDEPVSSEPVASVDASNVRRGIFGGKRA